MQLLPLYKEILKYCGLRVGENDRIETSLAYMGQDHIEADYAVEVEEKGVYMPTERSLKEVNKNGGLVFHPFHETLNAGESSVLCMLRRGITVRINFTVMILGHCLLEIAANPNMQRNMGRELRDIVSQIGEADDKSSHRWLEYVGRILGHNSVNTLVDIYVKKKGRYKDKEYPFVGVISMPFLKSDHGVEYKFKKNEEELFRSVYEAIFPNQNTPGTYGAYSKHPDVPRLDAMLRAAKTVTDRLNDLIDALSGYLPNVNDMMFDTEFIDIMEDLDPIRKEIRLIPPQKGNHGHAASQESQKPEEEKKVNYLPTPPNRSTVHEQIPQPPSDPQFMKPVPPPAPPVYQQPGYPYPQPQYQQPYAEPQPPQVPQPPQPPQTMQAPAAPAQQPAQLSTTETGKLDFKSVERVNPMVAAAGMVQTPLNTWGQTQQGVPMVDPRTGATYFMPPQPAVSAAVPAYSPMVQQVPLDAWGRPIAQPGIQPMAYPQPGYQQPAMQQPIPGVYGQQALYDPWGRPIGRAPAQPAFPATHVGAPLGRV